MNARMVICHRSETAANHLAEALLRSRIALSADVSVGLAKIPTVFSEPTRVDACLIDAALLPKCLEPDTLPRLPRGSSMKRIVMAPAVPNSLLIQAAQAGLDDVIDMSQSPEKLLSQFRDSLAGRHSLRAHPIWNSIHLPKDVHDLTSPYRDTIDREIVSMIAAGLTDDEISHGVYLSCQTVRNRISRMLERSGTRNRTQLAASFIREQYQNLESSEPRGGSDDLLLAARFPVAI